MKSKILPISIYLLAFMLLAGINACTDPLCTECLETPPPLNAYATELEARDHNIDSAVAVEWIQRYKDNKDSICNNAVGSYDSVLNYSEAFNKQSMLDLLCLESCIGLRVHYGMDPTFKVHLIITGVDQFGNDLFVFGKARENGMCKPPC